MSKDSNKQRKVLGQIKQPNTDLKSMEAKAKRKKNQFEKLRINSENFNLLSQEEDENETMLWDNQKREETLEYQKQKIINLRNKLLTEKKRILKKKLSIDSKTDYLNDLSDVYQIVKKCLEPNSATKTDSIVTKMNEVRFPEDFEDEHEKYIDEHIFDVPPPKPKSLPDVVLSMNEKEYQEYVEFVEHENEKRASRFEFDVPTDENIESNFDENVIQLYTNWLRLLTDEVTDLQQEEMYMDHSLGGIDTKIDRISDLIHVGMVDLGMICDDE